MGHEPKVGLVVTVVKVHSGDELNTLLGVSERNSINNSCSCISCQSNQFLAKRHWQPIYLDAKKSFSNCEFWGGSTMVIYCAQVCTFIIRNN